jgi:hypothetical protein
VRCGPIVFLRLHVMKRRGSTKCSMQLAAKELGIMNKSFNNPRVLSEEWDAIDSSARSSCEPLRCDIVVTRNTTACHWIFRLPTLLVVRMAAGRALTGPGQQLMKETFARNRTNKKGLLHTIDSPQSCSPSPLQGVSTAQRETIEKKN